MWLAWIALQRQNSCLAFSTLRLLHGARKSNQIRTAARSRIAPPDTRSLSPASLYADRRRLDLLIPRNPPVAPLSSSHCGWTAAHQRLREGISLPRNAGRAHVCRLKVSAAGLLLSLADAAIGHCSIVPPAAHPIQKRRRPGLKYSSTRRDTFPPAPAVGGCRPRGRRPSPIRFMGHVLGSAYEVAPEESCWQKGTLSLFFSLLFFFFL